MYASQKVPVFSSLRRPESLFRHIQGHQRAGTLTVWINIIQNKNITVYEAESQKTVNAKLRKWTNSFSEVIIKIHHHKFRSSQTGRRKKIEINVALHCYSLSIDTAKSLSSLRRPQTHFRHAQRHQRARVLIGSINIIQNTIVTVYKKNFKRQLTQNFENGLIVFQIRSNQRDNSLQISGELDWKTKKDRK